jgi:Na+/melibiose symporter-like transporter
MNSSSASSAPPGGEEKIYHVGTLRYTQHDLYVLFFWLMWNDFTITLLEQVGGLVGFLYKDYGASNVEMATFGSITGLITMWVNPWCSTWSDRTRTKYGRRRPFVFLATPFFALFLMLIPYMPDFYHEMVRYPLVAGISHHIPIKGEILFIFFCGFITSCFNSMVLAIFSYLYWDVVPANVLGRFNALAKIVTSMAGFTWNFFFFGMGEHNMKAVFVGVSIFCLVFYLISTWQIKEGEYPPPDTHKKGGGFAPVRAYFVECFSQPYFLWIFGGFTLYQLGNVGGGFQRFYLHYELGLSLDSIGKMGALPMLIPLVLAFPVGAMIDKFNPVRFMSPCYLAWGVICFTGYFFVRGPWSLLAFGTAQSMVGVVLGILVSAATVRFYPMEKLGQFCSASAISQQLTCALVAPFFGLFFDHTSTRVAFLVQACCLFAASLAFRKVYFNWKKRHGHAPVPHAG